MKLLIVFSILIFGSHASANPCEDTRKLKNLWETKYIKLIQNPEALGTGFESSSMAYKLANAICILEYPGLPNYNGDFYEYLTEMVRKIIINTENASNRNLLASTSQLGFINLHPGFFQDRSDTPFIRTSTLIHEMRHIELRIYGKFSGHVECTQGRHTGKQICDPEVSDRWEDASTHAYELFFLTMLYDKSAFYKNDLRIKSYTNDLLDTYFNNVSYDSYKRYYKP